MTDRFFSQEDLDLQGLSWPELLAWWDHWLHQAQVSNDQDEHLYSHGVFRIEPGWVMTPGGIERAEERGPSPGRGRR